LVCCMRYSTCECRLWLSIPSSSSWKLSLVEVVVWFGVVMRSSTMGAFHLFRMGIEQPTRHLSFCRLWLRVVHAITTRNAKAFLGEKQARCFSVQ
jgi:hypothetical protein